MRPSGRVATRSGRRQVIFEYRNDDLADDPWTPRNVPPSGTSNFPEITRPGCTSVRQSGLLFVHAGRTNASEPSTLGGAFQVKYESQCWTLGVKTDSTL